MHVGPEQQDCQTPLQFHVPIFNHRTRINMKHLEKSTHAAASSRFSTNSLMSLPVRLMICSSIPSIFLFEMLNIDMCTVVEQAIAMTSNTPGALVFLECVALNLLSRSCQILIAIFHVWVFHPRFFSAKVIVFEPCNWSVSSWTWVHGPSRNA